MIRWVSGGAQEIYDVLCNLNDRYALDGLSPCSYGGLLWCLGWADSPKKESRCFGTVRPRSARSLAKRYDLDKLARLVEAVEKRSEELFSICSCARSKAQNVDIPRFRHYPMHLLKRLVARGARVCVSVFHRSLVLSKTMQHANVVSAIPIRRKRAMYC